MKFVVIKKCAICNKRLGIWKDKEGKSHYEMEVTIDNLLVDNFKSYNCCGFCALDRVKQRNFEKNQYTN